MIENTFFALEVERGARAFISPIAAVNCPRSVPLLDSTVAHLSDEFTVRAPFDWLMQSLTSAQLAELAAKPIAKAMSRLPVAVKCNVFGMNKIS